jgi:hypothetical protein
MAALRQEQRPTPLAARKESQQELWQLSWDRQTGTEANGDGGAAK